jgi:hypothetical protein
LVSRLLMLLELCARRRVFFLVEQPHSSIMFQYEPWRAFEKRHGNLNYLHLDMGAYGMNAKKATIVCTNASFFGELQRHVTKDDLARMAKTRLQTRVATVDEWGRKRVKGGKDLKSTQAYPLQFGLALACHYCNWRTANPSQDRPRPVPLQELLTAWPEDEDSWYLQDILRCDPHYWHSNREGEFSLGRTKSVSQ